MLSAVLSPEEAEKVRTQYLMHHPAEEATAAERDLTLPAVGGGPVLLFGLDRASEFLTKTGHNYMVCCILPEHLSPPPNGKL